MAGLLLELRRQIAKNHRKGIYGNVSVHRHEAPNMKDSVPKRNSMAETQLEKELDKVIQQEEAPVVEISKPVEIPKPVEQDLPEPKEEAVDHITKLENDIQQLCREKDYLTSFIKWAGLREQYLFFRQNAREAGSPDLPFSWLECIPYPGAEPESGDSTLDA